jgi:hypothetical protein
MRQEMKWSERYATSDEYYYAHQEYLRKYVYPKLQHTQAAKDHYREKVLPLKPKPAAATPETSVATEPVTPPTQAKPQNTQLSFDI